MLSILIPVYNYDCSHLVADLASQCHDMKTHLGADAFNYEILLFDDASPNERLRRANIAAAERSGGRCLCSPANVGPAQARNSLIAAARFPYVLLVDSDAAVISDDFIARHWADRMRSDVICGSLVNPPGPAPKGCELRYRYEHCAGRLRDVSWRNAHPYASFTVFNALFRRDVLAAIGFDTRCEHYGHEDTLLGLRLQAAGVSILHTDNALMHMGIDSNESFLNKTELALQMIRHVGPPLTEQTRVAKTANHLRALHLARPIAWVIRIISSPLRRQILGQHPSLFLFALYKLGYYLNISSPSTITSEDKWEYP